MEVKKINWNTILLTALIAAGGWGFREMYQELRNTHDAVLGFAIQIADVRIRLSAVEIEIQKLKDHRP